MYKLNIFHFVCELYESISAMKRDRLKSKVDLITLQ